MLDSMSVMTDEVAGGRKDSSDASMGEWND